MGIVLKKISEFSKELAYKYGSHEKENRRSRTEREIFQHSLPIKKLKYYLRFGQ